MVEYDYNCWHTKHSYLHLPSRVQQLCKTNMTTVLHYGDNGLDDDGLAAAADENGVD